MESDLNQGLISGISKPIPDQNKSKNKLILTAIGLLVIVGAFAAFSTQDLSNLSLISAFGAASGFDAFLEQAVNKEVFYNITQ